MWFRRREGNEDKLEAIVKKLDTLLIYCDVADDLRKQNSALFDRLMSRNWDQWGQSPSVMGSLEAGMTEMSPIYNEDNAGGVLSDEDLYKDRKSRK